MLRTTDPSNGMDLAFEVHDAKLRGDIIEHVLRQAPQRVWSGHMVGKLRNLAPGEFAALLGAGQPVPAIDHPVASTTEENRPPWEELVHDYDAKPKPTPAHGKPKDPPEEPELVGA